MILTIAITIILATVIITKLAGKQIAVPGQPHTLQFVAIGFWLLSVTSVVIVAAYYLNMYGINITPKPVGL